MTREEKSNKLHDIFRKKFREIKSNEYAQQVFNKLSSTEQIDEATRDRLVRFDQIGNNVAERIEEYLSGLRPHVRSVSVGGLWRLVNDGPMDAVALEDPSNLDRVIVVEREYAEKILVLGLP